MSSSPYRSLPPPENDDFREPAPALIVACGVLVWLLLELGPMHRTQAEVDRSAPPTGRSGVASPSRR